MKKYPEEKIITILKEVDAKVAETCRKYGISDAIYYNWKANMSVWNYQNSSGLNH